MLTFTRDPRWIVPLLAVTFAVGARATAPDAADHSIRQFLAHDDSQHSYRAIRRLEAENGNRNGWLEATTEYSPAEGFQYQIVAEGGSDYIRSKVLKAVLDGERDLIAQGASASSSLALTNYRFEPHGIDDEGLVNVLLSPKRKDPALVSGMMFLTPSDGALVRLQGRLAKSPSFWLTNVNIVRTYKRIQGVVLPVVLESKANVRFMGQATLRMAYAYSEIDGKPLGSGR